MHKDLPHSLGRLVLCPVAASLLAVACTSPASFSSDLDEARIAIDNSDYVTAQSICDHLYGLRNDEQVTAGQLARLSILYMDLSNANDGEGQAENVAAATQCYIRAFEVNPDSAMAFYKSLSGGYDIDRLRPLNHIVSSVTGEDSIHEEPDSTATEFYENTTDQQ